MQPPPPMRRDAGPPRDSGAEPATDSGPARDSGPRPVDAGRPIPCADEPLRTEPFVGPYEGRVTAYYITPSDQALDRDRARYLACSLREIADFYRAESGRTFDWVMAAVPSVHDAAWFGCEGGSTTCWDRVLEQLRELGVTPGAARTLFLVALQGNYNYLSGARAAGADGGGISVFGADLYVDMIERRCPPGVCLSRLFSAVDDDGDGVAGALAAVLGYGLGLSNTPMTSPDYRRSVMGEYWHYPRLVFTSGDREILRGNRVLR